MKRLNKYNCGVLPQIQSVYYNNNQDSDYCSQVFLQNCRYATIVNNKLIHDVLHFTDTEPETEFEEEFNEDTK